MKAFIVEYLWAELLYFYYGLNSPPYSCCFSQAEVKSFPKVIKFLRKRKQFSLPQGYGGYIFPNAKSHIEATYLHNWIWKLRLLMPLQNLHQLIYIKLEKYQRLVFLLLIITYLFIRFITSCEPHVTHSSVSFFHSTFQIKSL